MTMYNTLRKYIHEYEHNKEIERMSKDDFVREVFEWAMERAKRGVQEGMFNISDFCQRYPEYQFDGTKARQLLIGQGLRVIGHIQKECCQHPKQMLINWMDETDYEYFYCGGRG